ncbi:adenylate kinase [Isoptericola halotolerans]|uniref:Adenylate kinase family enzyme n=1 Tax=Isoptericola halotolerans TaxID=300560 RepID=A0ABX2A9J3_9MICO|nr:AAA family ATPase [Isoptericola halotolerans]NOV98627.1 adenylate kinase family enzyme [Isoptericola halotolerans]
MPEPGLPRRVLVAGTSGAGKTTLATRLAVALDIPHTEIDALFHGPGWTPRAEFLDDVRTLVVGESWVTEWQYRTARPLLLERAELLVWLDLPLRVRMTQVIRRTVRRRRRRTVLWNGNMEPPLRTFWTDADHIVRWAWRTRRTLDGLDDLLAERAPHLRVVRLRSHAEAEEWLAAVAARAGRGRAPLRRDGAANS